MKNSTFKSTNNYRRTFSFFLIVATVFLLAAKAHSIVPPEFYAKAAKTSQIKAIAIVTAVNIVSNVEIFGRIDSC